MVKCDAVAVVVVPDRGVVNADAGDPVAILAIGREGLVSVRIA